MNWIMMILSFLFVFMSLSFVVAFIFQPYALMMMLLFISFLICCVIGSVYSSLLGFLLFMMYVGGVMILFMYVLSIFPNESMKVSGLLLGFAVLNSIFIGVVLFLGYFPVIFFDSLNKSLFYYMSMSEFSGLFLFMACFLFFVMICVSYFCMKKRLPFRKLS